MVDDGGLFPQLSTVFFPGGRKQVITYKLGGFSGGVLLDEPLLPASSLTRNTRNGGSGGDCGLLGGLV